MKSIKISEESNRFKNNLISNISHELKTPINVIMSAIKLYELKVERNNFSENKELSNVVNVVKNNNYRLVRLTNNVIDIARLESKNICLDIKNVNIVYFLENIAQSVIPYADKKGIEIIFDTTEEEILMAIDCDKIERVVLNILSNAIKFSSDCGNIFINLEKVNDKIRITIDDNGIGMDEKHTERIFDKFVQIDDTLTRQNEGSGIGLAIVKAFVELHGGIIYIDSVIQKGTKLTIDIPIKVIEESSTSNYIIEPASTIKNTQIELSDIYL